MIKSISLSNFKGVRKECRVELKPITLLFGPNSSGKSSIIQALHYAREIYERHNLDADRTAIGGRSIELGGFRNLLFGHDLRQPMELSLGLDLGWADLTQDLTIHSDLLYARAAELTSRLEWSEILGQPQITKYSLSLEGQPAGSIEASSDGRQVHLILEDGPPDLSGGSESEDTNDERGTFEELWRQYGGKTIGTLGQSSAHPTWGRSLRLDAPWKQRDDSTIDLMGDVRVTDAWDEPEFTPFLSNLFVGTGEVLRDSLRDFRYLGPLRDVPPRRFEATRSTEPGRWAEGLAAWDALYLDSSDLTTRTSEWLSRKDRLNTGYSLIQRHYRELPLSEHEYLLRVLQTGEFLDESETAATMLRGLSSRTELALVDENTGLGLYPQDIGVGLSQLVPVVVATLAPGSRIVPRDLVAIEQPELHVHPAIQVALGDLFIEQATSANRNFLIETHSEHLVLRLLRRIRETAEGELPPGAQGLSPDQLSVVWVENTDEGVTVTPLRVDETGEFIDRWPRGFFREREEELF